MVKLNVAHLYWLHLPEHSDMFRDGYIGVSINPERRLWAHKSKKCNPHLTNAFAKYKNIISTILLKGNEAYCYKLEKKLRPIEDIGWNIASGGGRPPSMLGKKAPWHVGNKNSVGKKRPDNITRNKANAMNWRLINSQGKIFVINNLAAFARKHKLDRSHLWAIANNKFGQYIHKGWTCEYIK